MSARSLVTRLANVQQAMTLGVVLVFAGSSLWVTASVLRAQERSLVQTTATRLARDYQDELGELHDPRRAALEVLSDNATPGIQAEIEDGQGRMLARTRPAGGSPHGPRGASTGEHATRSGSGVVARVALVDARGRASLEAL